MRESRLLVMGMNNGRVCMVHALGWVSLGMLAEALEGIRAAMHAWGFMDIESGYFAGGREQMTAQDGELGSPTDSLANGVVKGRPSAFPIPDYGKFSDGFSKNIGPP